MPPVPVPVQGTFKGRLSGPPFVWSGGSGRVRVVHIRRDVGGCMMGRACLYMPSWNCRPEVVCVVHQGRSRGRTGGRRADVCMRLFINVYKYIRALYVRRIEGTRNFGRYIMTGHVKTGRRVSSPPPRSTAPSPQRSQGASRVPRVPRQEAVCRSAVRK